MKWTALSFTSSRLLLLLSSTPFKSPLSHYTPPSRPSWKKHSHHPLWPSGLPGLSEEKGQGDACQAVLPVLGAWLKSLHFILGGILWMRTLRLAKQLAQSYMSGMCWSPHWNQMCCSSHSRRCVGPSSVPHWGYTELLLVGLGLILLDCILLGHRSYCNSSLHAQSTHSRSSTHTFSKSEWMTLQ